MTAKNTAIISGTMNHSNGNGAGSVNFAMRRLVSHRSWAEVSFMCKVECLFIIFV